MKTKHYLILAIIIPILTLLTLVICDEYNVRNAETFVFKISGYDPRDLISGHFLIYRVEYGVPSPCLDDNTRYEKKMICLKPLHVIKNSKELAACPLHIVGQCRGQDFIAGIERFYIPATESDRLDRLVRGGEVKLGVRITPSGKATATHLIINGESFY